jgi:hypothetical protein
MLYANRCPNASESGRHRGSPLRPEIAKRELTSTGVPTGIERQKRFGRFLSWLLETVRLRNAHELGVGARAEN